MGQPQSSKPFRIGPAAEAGTANTLTNGALYPSATGIKPDSMTGLLDQDGIATCAFLQGGHAANFGAAGTLQRQYSFDGQNFINDGAAITAATPVNVTLQRNLWYRWLVGGNDITGAHLYIG